MATNHKKVFEKILFILDDLIHSTRIFSTQVNLLITRRKKERKWGFSYRGKGVSVTGEMRFNWLEAPVLEGRLAQRPQEGARGPKRLCLRRCRRGGGLRRRPRRKPLRRLPASFPRADVEFMYFIIMGLLQGHLTSSTRVDEVHCRHLCRIAREKQINLRICPSIWCFCCLSCCRLLTLQLEGRICLLYSMRSVCTILCHISLYNPATSHNIGNNVKWQRFIKRSVFCVGQRNSLPFDW